MYNKEWLYNLYVQEQADEALYERAIDEETHRRVSAGHQVGFYTPNIFARIGLGLAMFMAVLFAFGLLCLFGLNTISHGDGATRIYFAIISLITGACCILAMLNFVTTRNDYNSGRDNVLLWTGVSFVVAFVLLLLNVDSGMLSSLVILIVTSITAYIFYDMLLSVVAFLSLLLLAWYMCAGFGAVGNAIASFVIMGISGVVYYLLTGADKLKPLYRSCFYYLRLASLVTLYAAGNYYMVCQAATGFSSYEVADVSGILGIFFWCCTFGIPAIYIYLGIGRRDIMLLRTGVLLVVAGILTFRYYHSVLPMEIALTLGGALCIVVAYWLMGYLKEEVGGFTSRRGFTGHEKTAIEQLVEGQVLKKDDEPGNVDVNAHSW